MESAFTDLGIFLVGFGSISQGGNAYVFENTGTVSRCYKKCFQKQKVLQKIRRRQKVLSNIARLQGSFRKNEHFFKFTKGTGGPGEKFC